MSRAVSMSLCLALIALFGSTLCEGYVSVPLTGYQQGITLQITVPTTTNEECYIYGVPTPFGYAPEGPSPLSVYTYKNTGSHVIQFQYKSSDYTLAPVFAPGDTSIQVDTSNPSNPLLTFDSNQSPQGKYGYISVQLLDKSGNRVCISSIALVVEAPLSCLPTWGGYYNTINPTGPTVLLPSTGGQIVVPGGNVYAPTYVQNTIIQQFVTINNVNINNINIINNVQQITNITIIKNVVAPPTPAPINCTATPTASACQNTARLGPNSGTPVIPIAPGSPITPGRAPPTSGPTSQTIQPVRAPAAPSPTVGTTQTTQPQTRPQAPTTQPQGRAQAPTTTTTTTTGGATSSGRRFRA